MRIAKLIRIGMALMVVFVVAISGLLFAGFGTVRGQVEQNDRIAGALDSMFELSMLTTDYLTYGEERAVRQWRSSHEALGEELNEILAQGSVDEELVTGVRGDHERVGEIFTELVEVRQRIDSGGPQVVPLEEHAERLVTRLMIVSQEMATDMLALSEVTSARVVGTTRLTFLALGVVAFTATIAGVVFSAWVDRALVAPLTHLSETARKVGSGDLKHRTGLAASPGELGDLARAFDAMVDDVQHSYYTLKREVTERRQAEAMLEEYRDRLEVMVDERTRELTDALEQLEAANAAKNKFLASMTHELRTPLNSIIGFTGVILGGLAGPVTDEQQRQLEMVKRSGEHLLGLISDLLDLSRIEAGKIDIRLSEFDPGTLCQATVALLGPLAEAKMVMLRCSVDPDTPRRVEGDYGKTEQILINLLENGIKFTEDGEISARVAPDGPDRFQVSVHDTGPGISAEELPYVFERFHRAKTGATVTVGGTGLGLEISQSLAEALGGSLTVVSEVGTGSVFTLTLPVRHSDA